MLQDIVAIVTLVFLEGLLSFDNALALAAMVKHLPEKQQKQALYLGMAGAFVFRFIALWFVVFLMENVWVKLFGGAYLVWLMAQFFLKGEEDETTVAKECTKTFIKTIIMVELTDIAFSIDSILAAVAVSNKLHIVVFGGVMGIIMMRFAASVFIKMIAVYPRLESTAFLLVGIVGTKLIFEGFKIGHFHDWGTPWPWVQWTLMGVAIVSGFLEKRSVQSN